MNHPRFALLLCSIALVAACRSGRPASTDSRVLKNVASAPKDRVGLGITVLNNDLALVRETRRVELKEGRQVLSFEGVSDEIVPESVRVVSAGKGDLLFFEEQNYDTDLISPDRIIEKAQGSRIQVYAHNAATGEEDLIEGVLLSGSREGILVQTDQGVREAPPGSRIEIEGLPKGLLSDPSLSWTTDASGDGVFEIQATYLTRGISWRADYVVDIDEDERKAGIQAWATIDNNTALCLENAGLQLLAGQVNVSTPAEAVSMTREFDMMEAVPSAPPMPKEEALFEYHLYTVERPQNLGARQQKQIVLASAEGASFEVAHKMRFYLAEATVEDLPTAVSLKIEHAEGGPLGVPLPAGKAAVWTKDKATGRRLQVGEVELGHTPIGEPLEIELAGDPATRGKWIPSRAQWDDNGRFIAQGELNVRNMSSAEITLGIEIKIQGALDIELWADGEKVSQNGGVWKIEAGLLANQSRTIAVQTRL